MMLKLKLDSDSKEVWTSKRIVTLHPRLLLRGEKERKLGHRLSQSLFILVENIFFCSNKPSRLTNKRELYWVHWVDHCSPGLAGLLCSATAMYLFGWPLGFLFSVEASRPYGRARPFFFFFSTRFKHLLQRSFCCDMNFWCAFSFLFSYCGW